MTADLLEETQEVLSTAQAAAPDPSTAPNRPGSAPTKPPRKGRGLRWALIAAAALVLLGVLLLAGVRYGAETGPGRALLVGLLDGVRVGPFGRLQLEGLEGDPFGDVRLARLRIVDARGPWLEASDIAMSWRPGELLARRFHARSIVGEVRVLRDPVLAPQPPSKPGQAPVSVALDSVRMRLQTLPAFSVRPGDFDVSGRLRVARNGAMGGRLDARSRLHAGDGLSAVFQLGEDRRVLIRADAVEASGGALAGALGLPADQQLTAHARADGSMDAGELALSASTGRATPLVANATWGKAGARLTARVALDASRLTAALAARAGPEAEATLVARHTVGDLYQVQAAATARNASAELHGPIDWRRRETPGAVLNVQVANLSQWASALQIGPTRATGVFTGDLDRFTYKGRVLGQHFTRDGYSLASVSGPAALSRTGREWRLQADLAGAGGSGQGLAPALLGPSPHLQLDGGRLPDGRFLARQLDVSGAGMKVAAEGGEGLFGALSFNGTADISNLAAVRPGARGRVTASWTAGRSRADPAWSFSFQAAATDFTSGIANLDHLLGRTPHLTAKASYGPQGLSIASSTLEGAAAQLGARGTLDAKGVLGLDLDWTAKGPFEAGPLEISGAAKGTGKLSGALATPKLDLSAELASLDLGRLRVRPVRATLEVVRDPSGFGGVAALSGSSAYGPASARSAFRIEGDGIALSGLNADAGGVKLAGAVSLRNGAPSAADLTVDARAGAFLSAGRIDGSVKLAGRGGALTADLALDGQDVVAPGLPGVVHTVHLKADGPWARLPFQLAADASDPVSWRFKGEGVLDQTREVRQVSLSGAGRLREADLRTLEPAVLRLGPAERDLQTSLSIGGGRADVAARLTGAGVDAKASLKGVALAAFNPAYVGSVDADVALSGQGGALAGTADATLKGARSRDAPANLALDARLTAGLRDERLHVVADATNPEGLSSRLDVSLPATASAAPFHLAIDRTKPLQGAFSADGELRPLWDVLAGGAQTLSGRVNARATLAGTLNDPRATGQASLSSGRFEDASSGLVLQDVALRADFDRDDVQVRQASGSDGHGGTMAGDGTVSLLRGGASTFALKLNRFRLFDNDLGRASVSGELAVQRDAAGHAKLSGKLRVDRADIVANTPTPSGVVPLDVVEINRPVREGEAAAAPPKSGGPPVALDVDLSAPRGVFVRGKGLNIELSLNAHVGGTAGAPDLTGTANVVLGSYDFAGKRFDIDPRGQATLASKPDQIRLDFTATLEQPTLTAVVKVSGTAAKPEVSLSSTPVLPQDEVLSQVLFGASASQLSPAQAAELASALASLAGGGGFDLLGRLRQFAGLDRLALGAGVSGTGVAGGKYINDNVYLELIGGGREGPSASVEWRVRKNFSIISQVGTQGDAELSVQFRRNY